MKTNSSRTRWAVVGITALLAACVTTGGSNLKPGTATLPEVLAAMGEPAMRWKEADGREQLAFTTGPAGTQTYMAFMSADGRLERMEDALDMAHYGRIVIGKSNKDDVLRLLGPSYPHWTVVRKDDQQIIWEWNTCDSQHRVARFNVYFDGATGIVRQTGQYPVLISTGSRGGSSYMSC